MPPRVPLLDLILIDQPHVRLMHQGSGVQGMIWPLVNHFHGGQFPQLVIHQRQQLTRRGLIAGLDLLENLCDVAHRVVQDRTPLGQNLQPRCGGSI